VTDNIHLPQTVGDYNSLPPSHESGGHIPSSPTDTVNTVIHNAQPGGGRESPPYPPHEDEDRVDMHITRQRSLNNFEPMIRPDEPTSPPPEDLNNDDEINTEGGNSESQRLVVSSSYQNNQSASMDNNNKKSSSNRPSPPARGLSTYNPGTCCYCLSHISCANIFLWITLVLALIAWSVSIWMSIDNLEEFSHIKIRTDFGINGMPFSDITVMTISVSTFLFSILFFVTSSFTSNSVSSYHLPSSQLNSCAYCVNITMTVFGCIAVILWTFIIAFTMMPTTVLSVIHILYSSGSVSCVHLPSYGLGTSDAAVALGDITYHCDEELSVWLDTSWYMMTPLLVSLGCALLIEMLMMGIVVVFSCNGRHLYERMGYLTSRKMSSKDSSAMSDGEQKQPFI